MGGLFYTNKLAYKQHFITNFKAVKCVYYILIQDST